MLVKNYEIKEKNSPARIRTVFVMSDYMPHMVTGFKAPDACPLHYRAMGFITYMLKGFKFCLKNALSNKSLLVFRN